MVAALSTTSTPLPFPPPLPPTADAQRSWIALIEKGLDFEVRKVDLNNKDDEFKALYASINPDPEAAAKVPILVDGDSKLIESNLIVEYLDTQV